MKRFACILLLVVQITFPGFAQDNPNAAIREKIRDIKLTEEFIFAEATSLNSSDDARKAAKEEMHTNVIALLTGLGKAGETAESFWNSIKDSCQTLEYQNITLHKAFTYILKSSATGCTASITSTAPKVVAPKAATQVAPISVPNPPLINLDNFDISEEDLEKPLNQDVNALLALATYESVIFYLDAMQDDGRIVYGRTATLTKPDEAYLIIIKDGKLITVLDKGKGKRMNLKTKEMEIVKKYQGYAIIWMKTFK